jgi:Na+/phosphate symporter
MELGEDGLGRVSIGLGLSVFGLILVNHLAASLRQSLSSAQRERE